MSGEGGATGAWSVVATTVEPRSLNLAFAAHHLAQGAAQVVLFLDEPADAGAHRLPPGVPVTVVPCDDAHWARLGGPRPADHRQRQIRNAEHAARSLVRTPWIAHLDVDEAVVAGPEPIADRLARVPAAIGAATLRAAERMFVGTPSPDALDWGGVAKRPGNRALGAHLWGARLGAALPAGFQGHQHGKSFRRTGRADLRFRIHRVVGPEGEAPSVALDGDGAWLLHLYPASRRDWLSKARRRLAPERLAEMRPMERRKAEAVARLIEEVGPDDAFEWLCVLDRARADDLVARGWADPVRLAPAPWPVMGDPAEGLHLRLAGQPGGPEAEARALLHGRGVGAGAPVIVPTWPEARWAASLADADRAAGMRVRAERQAEVAALRARGAPVLDWPLEVETPRDFARRLAGVSSGPRGP